MGIDVVQGGTRFSVPAAHARAFASSRQVPTDKDVDDGAGLYLAQDLPGLIHHAKGLSGRLQTPRSTLNSRNSRTGNGTCSRHTMFIGR